LTYESGTEFHARRSRGELSDIDPTQSRQLFEHVWDGLEQLGLQLYETSNFARLGQASRHNMAYWLARDYQAAGAGAVSTVGGVRVTREKHPASYITRIQNGENAAWRSELLDANSLLTETWMLGLRLLHGVSIQRLSDMGDDIARWRPRAKALIDEGLLCEEDGYLRLTRRGRPVQDEVTVYLIP
jgi:oxygen-independent coproporphyrinogen-3 oxidase